MRFIVGLLFCILGNLTYSYININPVHFDKVITGKGDGQEYTLYNGTSLPVRYTVYLDKPEREKTMEEWIEYYPKSITLQPGSEGKVRIYIKTPEKIEAGEYRAILGFREMAVPTEEAMRKGESTVKLLTNLRMEITGFAGDISPQLEFSGTSILKRESSIEFLGEIKNTGKRRGKYELYLTNSKNREKYFLGDMNILSGEKVDFSQFNQEIKNEEFLKRFKSYDRVVITDRDSGEIAKMMLIR